MRAMKDSGIAWIGEIPEDWEIKKLKYTFFHSNAGEVIDKSYWNCGSELLYTCQKEPINSNYSGFPEAKRTGINDLLLTRNATPYVFIPETHSIYSNVVQRISLRQEYDRRYIRYSLLSAIDSLVALGDTIPSYNMEIWENITLPIMQQQHRIADYLDRKCSQIDAIIARQQEVIEKLKAYKLSVITEAVTKGLNPHVPMKDSGVEWIGEIPEHWKIGKLCFFTVRIGDGLHGTPEFDDKGEYYFINGNNLGATYITIKENTKTVALSEYNKYFIALDENTLLISLNGTIGSVSQYHGEQIILGKSAGYIIIDSCRDLTLDYLRFYLQSKSVKTLFELSFAGTTINNLSLETLRNLPVCIMTSEEQLQISKVLDKKCLEIESTIQKKQILIERLAGYKKSLIYEVVTGKKEV